MLNDCGDSPTVEELYEVLKTSENVAYRLIHEKNHGSVKNYVS